jgi:3-hydroxybutyryl-CoA dehydrogenase
MAVSGDAIESLGVVGAGQMGNGIAHVAALAGLAVILTDVRPEALTEAMATIGRNLDRQVQKGAVTPEGRADALGRITTATETAALLKGLVPHLSQRAIIATNTSSISITRLAAATDRPHKVIGMHFMNPVPVMKLVEVIRGIATDEETFLAVEALARRMGKTTAVAEDYPAFIVNRILIPMINEAVTALMEGV